MHIPCPEQPFKNPFHEIQNREDIFQALGRLTTSADREGFLVELAEYWQEKSHEFERLSKIHQETSELHQKQANLDHLTQLFNRRGFESYMLTVKHLPKVLMLADVTHFKKINDTFGHDVGDKVLQGVGEALRCCIRKGDGAARWGGDEFGGVFIGENYEPIISSITQRLTEEVSALSSKLPELQGHEVSLSIGGTFWQPDEPYLPASKRADLALYEHKDRQHNGIE